MRPEAGTIGGWSALNAVQGARENIPGKTEKR